MAERLDGKVALVTGGTSGIPTSFASGELTAIVSTVRTFTLASGASSLHWSGRKTMTIRPGKTACLNCLLIDGPPAPGARRWGPVEPR